MLPNPADSGAVVAHVVPPETYFGDPQGWAELLRRSGADPLFMGHAWQSQWWWAFAGLHELTPCLLEFRGDDGAVRGRASFFRRRVKIKGLKFQTLEVLGNLWRGRGPATFRSEFLDVLAAPGDAAAVGAALKYWLLQDKSWDLMPAVDLAADGLLAKVLEAETAFDAMRIRESADTSFEMRIEGSIDDYRASLSGNTRRKMFGQRRKLQEALGPISLQATREFSELERLHTLRWGSPLLHSGRQKFLAGLLAALPEGSLHVSVLQAGSTPVSALLNACVDGKRIYNLQGGFDAGACESVSPARLHWGLLVEDAFEQRSVTCIDLLLGSGRADDYKQGIARPGRSAATIRVHRNPILRIAQSLQALIPSRKRGALP